MTVFVPQHVDTEKTSSVGDTRLASGGRVLGSVTFSSLKKSMAGDMDPALESAEAGAIFLAMNSLDTLHSH